MGNASAPEMAILTVSALAPSNTKFERVFRLAFLETPEEAFQTTTPGVQCTRKNVDRFWKRQKRVHLAGLSARLGLP